MVLRLSLVIFLLAPILCAQQQIGGGGGSTSGPAVATFTWATSCTGLANCFQGTDDDSTDNCGTALTTWLALVNAYAGPGRPQVYISGSGAGKAYKLATSNCVIAFTNALGVSVHLRATIDCAQAAQSCIQLGETGQSSQVTGEIETLDGVGTLYGGASLTLAGVYIEPGVNNFIVSQIVWAGPNNSTAHAGFGANSATLGSCTNWSLYVDSPVSNGTVVNSTDVVSATSSTSGGCGFANLNGASTGSNTIYFVHNVIGTQGNASGSGECGSVGIADGGSYGAVANNPTIFGFGIPIRVQGIQHRVIDNEIDANNCSAHSVNAAIQVGGASSSTPVGPITVTDNVVQMDAVGTTNLVAIAGDSTATLIGATITGNQNGAQSSAGTQTQQMLPAGFSCSIDTTAGTGCNIANNINMSAYPAPTAADTFTRANATGWGPAWSPITGSSGTDAVCNISSNTGITTTTNSCVTMYIGQYSSPDQYSSATVSAISATSDFIVMTRMQAGTLASVNGYMYVCSTAGGAAPKREIQKVVANTQTNLAITSANSGCGAGDKMELDNVGPLLLAYYTASGGTRVLDLWAYDTTWTSGYPGIFLFQTGAAVTNWLGGSLVAGSLLTSPYLPDSARGVPLKAFVRGADYTNATTGFTAIVGASNSGPGLAFPVAANTNYTMHCAITWSASAATAGPQFEITGPASPTSVTINMVSAITATTTATAAATAFSSALNPVGATVTSATNETAFVDMSLINGTTAGTAQLLAASQGTGTVTIRQGSSCTLE